MDDENELEKLRAELVMAQAREVVLLAEVVEELLQGRWSRPCHSPIQGTLSGQNVAFLLALARPLMERAGLRSRWVIGVVVLVVFVLVTRAEASVLRAAAMAAVALTAAGLGRVAPGARILGLAVCGLLLVERRLDKTVVDGVRSFLAVVGPHDVGPSCRPADSPPRKGGRSARRSTV